MLDHAWDPEKEEENRRTHHVGFDDARVALRDPLAVRWFDESHSLEEPRFITIGRDLRGRYLAVVTSESVLQPRIISARRATKRERHAYAQQRPFDPV